MKLTLDVKIPIEIREGGKTKEKLEVFYRDFTKKEKIELDGMVAKFKALFKKTTKISATYELLEKKIELSEKLEDFASALKFTEEKERLLLKIEELQDEIEALGGDGFEEEMAKKRFDLLVSGKDKTKLREYAEIKGYSTVLTVIEKTKADYEKKQHGE